MKTENLTLAYKLRHVLDQNVADLPVKTMQRLEFARKTALAHKKPTAQAQAVLAHHVASAGQVGSSSWDHRLTWLNRMSFAIPFAILGFGLMGIYQYEQHQQLVEAAYIDAEVLTGELPLSAYLDNGFDAYLNNNGSN